MLRFLCFLLLAFPVGAQSAPESALTSPLPSAFQAPHTRADTVKALHVLFRNRRTAGGVFMALGAIALVATPFVAATAAGPGTSTYGNLPEAIGGVRLGFIVSAPILALGVHHLVRGAKDNEEAVIDTYTDTHLLPRSIKRRLRPALFLPPPSSPDR